MASHPILLTYTSERLKLRLVMHQWLKDECALKAELSLRTLLKYPEEKFVRCYVKSHPRGASSLGETEEIDRLRSSNLP